MPGKEKRTPAVPAQRAATHRRLDGRTWQALGDIAQREGTTAADLLDQIARTTPAGRLLSATRLFVVEYYRSLLTETMARRH
jgi:predicted DNA-binding ribbon-helix-helix protein